MNGMLGQGDNGTEAVLEGEGWADFPLLHPGEQHVPSRGSRLLSRRGVVLEAC